MGANEAINLALDRLTYPFAQKQLPQQSYTGVARGYEVSSEFHLGTVAKHLNAGTKGPPREISPPRNKKEPPL